ncbi:MAG: 3-oxoacyl-[acyl-carrier-protein] reductase [Fidelibacterota bacterium]
MELNFTEKVVLVTGSGRGIGRTIAETFARQGATIVLSDYNAEALTDAKQEFLGKKYPSLALPCDVTREDQVNELIEQIVNTYNRIDIIVNNAGITRDTLLMRMKTEQWDAVINTNLKGVFLVTKAVTKQLIKQRFGKIINISSVIGLIGNAGQGNYAASKAGVIGFTKSVARELASRNITVNAIAPGYIETEMTRILDEKSKETMLSAIPLKRAGNSQDVANAALFLASPLADYITGQVIKVDGGMVM